MVLRRLGLSFFIMTTALFVSACTKSGGSNESAPIFETPTPIPDQTWPATATPIPHTTSTPATPIWTPPTIFPTLTPTPNYPPGTSTPIPLPTWSNPTPTPGSPTVTPTATPATPTSTPTPMTPISPSAYYFATAKGTFGNNHLLALTRSGTIDAKLPIGEPGFAPLGGDPQGVVVLVNGDVAVYNTGSHPFISVYHRNSNQWTYLSAEAAGNISPGSITTDDYNYIYIPYGSRRIARFHSSVSSPTIRSIDDDVIDLTYLSSTKLICALHQPRYIKCYNSAFTSQGEVHLSMDVRAIAVSHSTVIGAAADGMVYKFDSHGSVISSINTGVSNLIDINALDVDTYIVTSESGRFVRIENGSASTFFIPGGAQRPVYAAHIARGSSLLLTSADYQEALAELSDEELKILAEDLSKEETETALTVHSPDYDGRESCVPPTLSNQCFQGRLPILFP